jgi:hypothetical protein
MPDGALPNGGAATDVIPVGSRRRVSDTQPKLHGWAAGNPGRRFDDLFNFVWGSWASWACPPLVLGADIEACFDSIDHLALMDRVGAQVEEQRVLMLTKAFPKAGIMAETGRREDPETGTLQGGLCAAEHNPPYEQCRVMRCAGLLALVTATLGVEHCA